MTPAETMAAIISLRQAHKFEEAASHYAEDAAFVVEPGKVLLGRAAVEASMRAMGEMFPTFSIDAREVVVSGPLALHHSLWVANTAASGDGQQVTGKTADVLALQPDGRWMVMIDNPWGIAVLGA